MMAIAKGRISKSGGAMSRRWLAQSRAGRYAGEQARGGAIVRSLLFKTYFYLLTLVTALTMTAAMVWPGDRHIRRMLISYTGAVQWGLGVFGAIRVERRGVDRLPHNRPFILISKHMSDLDPIAQFRVIPNMTALAKKELFAIPLIGVILRRLKIVRVDRQSGTAHHQMPAVGRQITERNQALVVYPEGTRTLLGERRKLKSGAFHLHEQTGLPIVTCATNSGAHWLKGRLRMVPGTVVYEFSDEFPPAASKHDFMAEVQKRVITRSETLMAELDGIAPPSDDAG